MKDKHNKELVGIVTFTDGYNYGQRLQNYAVQEFLLGYFDQVYTFVLRRPDYGCINAIKRNVKSVIQIKNTISKRRKTLLFKRFNKKHLSFWPQTIYEDMDSTTINERFSLVVAGSDQVWNPNSAWVSSVNFLRFVSNRKRMSFAASFSTDVIPDKLHSKYRQYLSEIPYITVRENKGAEIIFGLCGIDVPVVLDPTLLYGQEFWIKIAEKPSFFIPEHFALSYFLGENQFDSELKEWADSKGLLIINIGVDGECLNIGPAEFVYLISKADYVFTDSYHGTIFSIIFNREFRNFTRIGADVSMNSRFDTLYQKMKLQRSVILDNVDLDSKIDYSDIMQALEEERIKSSRILDMIIRNIIEGNSGNSNTENSL